MFKIIISKEKLVKSMKIDKSSICRLGGRYGGNEISHRIRNVLFD